MQTRTFKIGIGGKGINEVDKFISNTIGRDLTLIDSITAASINASTSELALTFRERPKIPVQASNPPNGFIALTGEFSEVHHIYFQMSTPIKERGIGTGDVLYNTAADVLNNNDIHVLTGQSNNYVIGIQVSGQYGATSEGVHTIIIQDDIISKNGDVQNSAHIMGWTNSQQAVPWAGDAEIYSDKDLRGITKLKYALIDSSASVTKKIREMLNTRAEDLLAFTTASKGSGATELYMLVVEKSEPRVVKTYPRMGALNPLETPFEELLMTFAEPIDTNQATSQSGVFAIARNFNDVPDIAPSFITKVDNKTLIIDVTGAKDDLAITDNYVNIVMKPGFKSSNGLALTKGYLYGYIINAINVLGGGSEGRIGATGLQGPTGEPGRTGERGVTGESGARGADGESGVSGAQGDIGADGATGASGASGAPGDQGDAGRSGDIWHIYTGSPTIQLGVPGGLFFSLGGPGDGGNIFHKNIGSDWILTGNISGAKGAKGDQGNPGDQGGIGPIGNDGIQGQTGDDGGYTGTVSLNASFERPIPNERRFIGFSETNITIQDAVSVIYMNTSQNTGYIEWQLEYGTDMQNKGDEVFDNTITKDGAESFTIHTNINSSLSSFGANNIIFVAISGVSGAPDQFDVTIRYTVD